MDDDQTGAEPSNPIEAGRPTIMVFLDTAGNVEVGAANYDFEIEEMIQVLGIASAKLGLLRYQVMRREAKQAAVRQSLLQGIR